MIGLLTKIFINKSGAISSSQEKSKVGVLCGIIGIIFNIILFTMKYIVGLISGSVSIITDAFNNITDAGTSLVMLIGVKISSYGRGDKHPQGHGRIEWIISSLMAFLVMGIGWNLLSNSMSQDSVAKPIVMNPILFILMLCSVVVKGYMYLYNKKYGRLLDSEVMKAVSVDSISDAVATTAVLISVILSVVFHINLDKYCGMLVSIFIIYNGFKSLCETTNRIIGTVSDPEEIEDVRQIVLNSGIFTQVYELTIEDYGRGNRKATIIVGYTNVANGALLQEDTEKVRRAIRDQKGIDSILMTEKISADAKNRILLTTLHKTLKSIEESGYIDNFRVLDGVTVKSIYMDIHISKDHEYKEAQLTTTLNEVVKHIDKSYCVYPRYLIFHELYNKPWVHKRFARKYDTYMKRRMFPRNMDADLTKHNEILQKKLCTIHHKTVLDVACRSGDAACFLPSDNTYIGLDINSLLLEQAEEKMKHAGFTNYTLIEDTGHYLKYEDGSMDVLLCNLSMHTIYPYIGFLQEAYRVLKEDGVFIGSLPIIDYGKKSHYYSNELNTSRKIEDIFLKCGFDVKVDSKINGSICYFEAKKNINLC